ncbi:MAG: sialidase family protein, partial [Acidobacteriota bacterium]|nr:sialidase family protein [Acidobacteriota bacterium]
MLRFFIIFALLGAASLCLFLIPREEPTPLPAPTEVARYGDESDKHRARREWFEKIHRAAPGVDWREIERGNWQQHLRTRNRLAKDGHVGTRHWLEVGSSNQAGRTHSSILSNDKKTIYVGTDLGGLWRADLENAPDPGHLYWEPISDGIYGGAYHAAQMADGRLLKASDGRIHYSTDNGLTWEESTGLTQINAARGRLRILGEEEGDQVVMFMASKPRASESRLYRSLSGGEFFGSIRTVDGHGDIWTDRTKDGPLYMLGDGKLEVTHDRGDNWEVVGVISEDLEDTVGVLAGSEAGAPTFYAAIAGNDGWQVYISQDGGVNWTMGAVFDDFWSDFHSLEASITDPNLLFHGGVEVHRSIDGGMSFEEVHRWWWYYDNPDIYLHADIPGFNFHIMPDGREMLFVNTDGGTYYSEDGGETFNNAMLFGMNVNQIYDILTDKDDPGRILSGTQDQGYQFANVGDSLSKFDQVISGDYGHLVSADGSHDVVFSNYPGFTLVSVRNGDGNDLLCCNMDFPEDGQFNWIPFMAADPDDPWKAYICGDRLWELSV